MDFLVELPLIISIPLIITLSVLLSMFGLIFVRKRYTEGYLRDNHEVGGYFFNAFGLLYAVLIAFVVYVTWTEFDTSIRDIELEANQTYLLYFNAGEFPEPSKTEIRNAVKDYINVVINDEWKKLPAGDSDMKATYVITKLFDLYSKVDKSYSVNSKFYEESITRLNELSELRRLRILASISHVPTVVWIILIIGWVVSIAFTYFFGMKNAAVHYTLVGILCSVNALLLFLIYDLDHPFTGNDKISTHAFEVVLQVISSL
ncbi:MAG: DUF4239 domain-containing protein [Ignavibacteria bacterium]|nr:DUF4239 domain-containing protein [Ignavibacteria bacterium]